MKKLFMYALSALTIATSLSAQQPTMRQQAMDAWRTGRAQTAKAWQSAKSNVAAQLPDWTKQEFAAAKKWWQSGRNINNLTPKERANLNSLRRKTGGTAAIVAGLIAAGIATRAMMPKVDAVYPKVDGVYLITLDGLKNYIIVKEVNKDKVRTHPISRFDNTVIPGKHLEISLTHWLDVDPVYQGQWDEYKNKAKKPTR